MAVMPPFCVTVKLFILIADRCIDFYITLINKGAELEEVQA
jgi:hypothetical protein